MDLKAYLESRNITHEEFAKMIKIHPRTLCNYLNYHRIPPLNTARDIVVATRGKVSYDDLLEFWDKKYG